jgi:hypothetical protein
MLHPVHDRTRHAARYERRKQSPDRNVAEAKHGHAMICTLKRDVYGSMVPWFLVWGKPHMHIFSDLPPLVAVHNPVKGNTEDLTGLESNPKRAEAACEGVLPGIVET